MSESEVERMKKELVQIYKNNGLSMIVRRNLKAANFLDIHFNLVKETYQPFKNPIMTFCTLGETPIIHHQYYDNFTNQSQKQFQTLYKMNLFLTNQTLITRVLEKKWV